MEIVHNKDELKKYFKEAVIVSGDSPVLIDHYLKDSIEVDVDAVSDGKKVIIAGIMEHIEEAGIHSGDSTCTLPPYSLSEKIIKDIEKQTKKLAIALDVKGLLNIQFAIQNNNIFLLEVNPRSSRTVPFVAKATGTPIVKIALNVAMGKPEDPRPDAAHRHSPSCTESLAPIHAMPFGIEARGCEASRLKMAWF